MKRSSVLSLSCLAAAAALYLACGTAPKPSSTSPSSELSDAGVGPTSDAGEMANTSTNIPSAMPSATGSAPSPLADGGTIESTDPGRTREDIFRIMTAKRAEGRACFDQAAAKNPGLEGGNVMVRWVIDPKGVVKDVKVDPSGTTIDNISVGNCLADMISKFSFPASTKKLETRAAHTFNFKARHAK
jgi:hypothetical protein